MANNGNCDYCDLPKKTRRVKTSTLRGDWSDWPGDTISVCEDCMRDLRKDKPGNPGLYEAKK